MVPRFVTPPPVKEFVVWKMYATLVLGVSIVALLCYPLPGESVAFVSTMQSDR